MPQLTERQKKTARTALQKALDKEYTEAQQMDLGFGVDTETEDSYTWHFTWEKDFGGDGKRRNWTYIFATKSIVKRRVD